MTPEAGAGPHSTRPPVSAAFIELVAASLLLLWRIWILTPRELMQDITATVAAFWLALRFIRSVRHERILSVAVMAALLALYAVGQFPQTWSLLGGRP